MVWWCCQQECTIGHIFKLLTSKTQQTGHNRHREETVDLQKTRPKKCQCGEMLAKKFKTLHLAFPNRHFVVN